MAYYNRRVSPIKPGEPIDYKDVDLLRRFITERGKILPRRITGLTAKQQRELTTSIKRARVVALLPFINKEG
jgi:small subunit ribosomal protein S18